MQAVCLDTMIVIWGIKGECEGGQEPERDRAMAYVSQLRRDRVQVIIPSVVIGEALVRVPLEDHTPLIQNILERKFIIAPVDLRISTMYARIWRTKSDDGTIAALKQDPAMTRRILKFDCLIAAAAAVWEVGYLCSNDNNVRRFGEGYINVQRLIDIPVQMNIPGTIA